MAESLFNKVAGRKPNFVSNKLANISELIDFYSPWNHQKTTGKIYVCKEIKAAAQCCSVKKLFLKILQNSQENICARASFLIKLQASQTRLNNVSNIRKRSTSSMDLEFYNLSLYLQKYSDL